MITVHEHEEQMPLVIVNEEMKGEGSVNWYVYTSYLRAGAGFILGIFLVIFVFGIREGTSVYCNWWLAKWTNDESHRNRAFNNCTIVRDQKINMIRSMSDDEWNNYRNGRFSIYCGL